MGGLLRVAGVLVLAGASCVSAWGQTAAAPLDPHAVLSAARQIVQQLSGQQSTVDDKADAACKKAGEADQRLFDSASRVAAEVEALAGAASHARKECDEAEAAKRQLTFKLAESRALLRSLALDLSKCTSAAGSCTALRLGQQVLDLAAAGTGSVDKIVQAASTAQKRVADQKAAVAEAFALGDKAAALALASTPPDPKLAAAADEAFDRAAAARRAAGEAQRASNQLVGAALQLMAGCESADLTACKKPVSSDLLSQAKRAQDTLALKLEDSKLSYERAKLASIEVEADVAFDGPAKERAVLFLRALDETPNARDLMSKDSYTVSAGAGGAGLAIKVNNQKFGGNWFRGSSLTISTPTAESGNSALFTSADGFTNASKLEFANTFFVASGLNSGKGKLPWLHQSGASVAVGHQRLTYVDQGDLATEQKRTLVPWAVSVFSAVMPLSGLQPDAKPGIRPDAFFAKLSWQRQVEEGDTSITCPVAVNDGQLNVQNVVTCSTGPFGKPRLVGAWQAQFEYRVKNKDLPDLSLVLKHNVRPNGSKAVTNLDMPVYLLKTSSDESPIHAGVNLGWSSKGGSRFGIFLGAPLSLYKFDR